MSNIKAKSEDEYFGNRSLSGNRWRLRPHDERRTLTIYQKFGYPEIVSRLLSMKNIDLAEVDAYMNPTLRDSMPDPNHLLDMEKGVNAVVEAIYQKKKICIFGDYDVDGATASAIMKRFFHHLKKNVDIYIPDRTKEGYGLNREAVMALREDGVNMIITVDCGTSSIEPIELANELCMKVVVTDHHMGSEELPPAEAVINPNRLDEKSEYGYLSGAGVAFMFCVALNRKLRELDYYKKNALEEPDLLQYLDLVALGTICDLMPLVGFNRALTGQGMKIIRQRTNRGINALFDVAGVDEAVTTHHIGYIIGPRINASGRIGTSDLASQLLCCDDPVETKRMANMLNELNKERQEIEKIILDEAIAEVEKTGSHNESIVFVGKSGWHDGVIGIVSSRIKEKYGKPAVVYCISDGVAKASCRSVHNVDIGSFILDAKNMGIIDKGGGHIMAGGFSLDASRIGELKAYMLEKLGSEVEGAIKNPEHTADLVLDCESVNIGLVREIEKLGPFGAGNHKPSVILKDVAVVRSDIVGKNQNALRLILAGDNFTSLSKGIVGMLFNTGNHGEIVKAMTARGRKKVHLLGELAINTYLGNESVQFIIKDVQMA